MFKTNLDAALSGLPTTNSGYGFYNLSTGHSPDQVNSIALCRGDIAPDSCRVCVTNAVRRLRQFCPNQRKAIGYYEKCSLRYSDETILGNNELVTQKNYYCMYNVNNATDVDLFNQALRPWLQSLAKRAAGGGSRRKFATNETISPDVDTIYGLVQCTPDLSTLQCNDCLGYAFDRITSCCYGKVGGIIFLPSCNFRYEIYSFYGETPVIPPPASPAHRSPVSGASPPAPPPPGNNTDLSKSVVAIITATVILVVIIASICIFTILRKKKKKLTENCENETLDISNIDTLQYNFSTVREATDDFSENSKLGEGGFGSVYKGKLQNGENIAVKRLSMISGQGEIEFKNEVML